MATIDFPNSPTVGDLFTAGSVSYKWTGVAWISNNIATFEWDDITGKPATFPPSTHTHVLANITDVTATATELNYVDGVTSSIQTQLNGKAATSHTHTLSQITDYTPPVIPEVTFTNTFMLMGA
jgi:hypothetical protein